MNRNLNQVVRCDCCEGSGICSDNRVSGGANGEFYKKFVQEKDNKLTIDERKDLYDEALDELEIEIRKLLTRLATKETVSNRAKLNALRNKKAVINEQYAFLRDDEKRIKKEADLDKLISNKQVEKKEEKTAVSELLNNPRLSAKQRKEYEDEVMGKTFYDERTGNPLIYDEASGTLIRPRTTQSGEYKGQKGLKKRIPKRKY